MDHRGICIQVKALSEEIGAYIREERKTFERGNIEAKASHDYVTQVDKNAEEKFVDGLSKILPEAGFIAEEGTSDKKGTKFDWVIDPLDGTTNFIHDIPSYCTSVALLEDGVPVIGVVLEVPHQECFYAWKGSPAYMNGQEIQVSKSEKITDSLIATGFPRSDFERYDPYMELFKKAQQNSRGIRRLGSAAADLIYVACGRFDVFYEYGLAPWDVAAGALIVQAAGGKVTDFNNGKDFIFGQEIVATNGQVHKEFLEMTWLMVDG